MAPPVGGPTYMGAITKANGKHFHIHGGRNALPDSWPFSYPIVIKPDSSFYYRVLNLPPTKAVNSVEFPSSPPAQYWPGLTSLSYGVRMGSGVFDVVWSTAAYNPSSLTDPLPTWKPDSYSPLQYPIVNHIFYYRVLPRPDFLLSGLPILQFQTSPQLIPTSGLRPHPKCTYVEHSSVWVNSL